MIKNRFQNLNIFKKSTIKIFIEKKNLILAERKADGL